MTEWPGDFDGSDLGVRLVASGADLRTIMSLTGHTQVVVLIKHYAQVMDGKQKEVLDKVFG